MKSVNRAGNVFIFWGLFQSHDLFVADPEAQPVDGPSAIGIESGVGAPIGHGDVGVGVDEATPKCLRGL